MMNTALFTTRMSQDEFTKLANREKLNFQLASTFLGVVGTARYTGHESDVAHLRHVIDPVHGDHAEALTELGILALTL